MPHRAARRLVTHRTSAAAAVADQPDNRVFLDGPDDHARMADGFGGRRLLREGDTVRAYAYVDGDNRGGARQAVQHLVQLGRRHSATVTGPYDQEQSAAERPATWTSSRTPRPS
ncbi:hypothetical protein ACWC09_14170 [Streptomyces sp. NPDC001617]